MRDETKAGFPLKAATIVYLLLSVLGLPLFQILPPVVNAIGARIHVYMAMGIAVSEGEPSTLQVFLLLSSMIFVVALAIVGIRAVMKERYAVYAILAAVELVCTVVFFLILNRAIYEFAAGMIINAIYCVWLLVRTFRKKRVKAPANRL